MGYKETYNRWLTSDVVDDDTKAELKSIENNEKEIEERQFKNKKPSGYSRPAKIITYYFSLLP